MNSPIAIFIFKRPEITRRLFEEIRKARPNKLFIIDDFPRSEEEKVLVDECKRIVDNVDWDCEVYKNYSLMNMGPNKRIATGIDWVFTHVDEAIFLEDDCFPDQTFFQFCDEMLEKYRYDQRVMAISGDNFHYGRRRTEYSYYFSKAFHIWGWATWKRAWKYYDFNLSLLNKAREEGMLEDVIPEYGSVPHFERALQDPNMTWDYKLNLCFWLQNGLCITPNQNLVSNVGFGADGTYAINPNDPLANIPIVPMEFPLKHPLYVMRDRKLDLATMIRFYS